MKYIALSAALACCGLATAHADSAAPAPAAKAVKAPSVAQTLKQLEQDWADAQKSQDVDKFGQIVAEDWSALGYDGKRVTKQTVLEEIKAGKDKVDSIELGAMDVKVLGNVAVVQGSDTEKSMTNGKDTSGNWVWTDVFVKRDGKWLAVRSQSAKIK